MVDLKKAPYFATYDESKKYYRILARPGRPIQVREWNELQSQIQKQIERVGLHLFKNGSQILPGTDDAVTYRNNIGFVKLSSESSQIDEVAIQNLWMGKTVRSTSTPVNIKAKVIGYRVSDTLNEIRLFVDYIEADALTGSSTEFVPGHSIETVEPTPVVASLSADPTSVGLVSGVFIKNSVYFFNGDFILVDEQSVICEPSDPNIQTSWNNAPTGQVGLSVESSVVTFQDDESLGDNATASENFGAPGADRLYVNAVLEQRDLNQQNDGQFIELLRVSSGVVQQRVRRTAYNVIEDTLARRTSDESGDYTVKDFPLIVRPFLKEGDNGGVRLRSEYQFATQSEAEEAGLRLFGISAACADPESPSKWLPASSADEFLRLARGKLTLQIDPGKAYVKGYEVENLAPSYVDIDKARTTRFQNNRLVNTNLGAFVYITSVFGPPEIEKYEIVELHQERKSSLTDITLNSKIGTARVLAVEHFSGTHGSPDAVYKLFLFDVNAEPDSNINQMKSVRSVDGLSFSANLVLEFSPLEGSVTTNGSSSSTLVGNGTSFQNKTSQKLSIGDFIRVGNSASQIYQISSIESDISVTLGQNVTISGNQSVEFAFASFHGLEDARGLVFPLPEQFAYTIRSANDDRSINDTIIDTVFSVRRAFVATSNNAGVIQLQTNIENEQFLPYSPNDYIVVNTSSGDWVQLASGTSYDSGLAVAGVELVEANQVKIHANPAEQGDSFYVIASIAKTGGYASKEKTKTLIKGSFVADSYSGPFVVSDLGRSDLNEILLGQSDILRVTRIIMSPDFAIDPSPLKVLPVNHVDVTDRYILDNGQRDYYYGIGSVYLKPGVERPTGKIRVEFDYFSHSAQGAYFSVDSYPFKGTNYNLDYSDIPNFIDSAGRVYSLRDCLDFRPRLEVTGQFAQAIDVPRSSIRLDFHHYLHRVDNLYVDKFGVFNVAKGVPDVDPVVSDEPGEAMSLYHLDLQAYTASPDECYKRKVDNRRYTMRDIGKLEKRVTNLEYYTVLSLLEKEAKDLEIKDAQGFDRFKNGFIVDNFRTHGIGNIKDSDYRCSVDVTNEELRPSIHQANVGMVETNSLELNSVIRDQQRELKKYTRTGKAFTLPYSVKKFAEQQLASQVENVNPFAKFTFRGRIKLDPSTDTWRDTETLPKLEVYDDTAYLAAQAGVNPNQVIWGEWEESWTKTHVGKKPVNRVVALGPYRPDAVHRTNWPKYVEKGQIITTTTTTKEIRNGLKQSVVDKGYQPQSLGKRITATRAADFMRTQNVNVEAMGFMPNARLYAFFNDENVGQFCNPNGAGFGSEIRADGLGSVSLVFKIPQKRFLTGERIFKLSTSESNSLIPQPVSEGETKYYAVGWIDQVQETELSIRQFEIQNTVVRDSRITKEKNVETRTKVEKEDPIAQSFSIKEKGGCFLLAVDVYFYSKDQSVPVKLQLRPLSDDGYPTNFIMPFGEVVKPAADVIVNEYNPANSELTVRGDGDIAGYTVGPWDGSESNPRLIERVTNLSGSVIPNGSAIGTTQPHRDMIPTRFIFDTPVYLKEGNDYAIVLLADSVQYQAWVSQSGPITARPGGTPTFGKDVNTILGTNTPILKDNFLDGVFFRSSNGTTWNAEQLIDMKFALHKAEFLTNDTGVIEFVNDEIPLRELINDPLETFSGTTKVRVYHRNHGHPAFATPPARVVLTGVTGTVVGEVESVNGIPVSLLNSPEGWPIESVELDSYVIDVVETSGSPSLATASGRVGGVSVFATENRSMDSLFFNANALSFPETSILWTCSTTNGGNVSYADPNPKSLPFVVNPFVEIEPGTTVYFNNPMTVSSVINENNALDSVQGPSKVNTNETGARKSLRIKAVLRSFNSNLSPVLDSDRLAVHTIANRINNPSGAGLYSINTTVDSIEMLPTEQSPAVASTADLLYFHSESSGVNRGRIKTDDPDVAQHLSKLDVGKLVTITGCATVTRNVSNVKVVEVTYTPNASPKCSVVLDTSSFGGSSSLDSGNVVIVQKERFIDEIAPSGGSAAFKYITKQLALARQSTALRISFDANRNDSHQIDVYYRLLRADSASPIEDVNWTKAIFGAENEDSYPDPNSFDDEMNEYSVTLNNLPPFLGVSVKIVGRGGNSARPPRIANFKMIALDE